MSLSKRFPRSIWLRRVRSPLGGWLWSIAFLGAMFALRYGLTPWLQNQFPYVTFTFGVILTSLFVGWQSAIVILLIGFFLGQHYFLHQGLFPNDVVGWFGAVFYFFINGVIIAYAETAYQGLMHSQEIAQELESSYERFRLATEAMQGMVYEWDLTTNHVERTTGLKQMLGYEEGEDEPTAQWWNTQIHPEDRATLESVRAELAHSNHSIYETEYRVRNKAGAYVWVSDKCLIQRDKEQNIIKIIGCTVDITERVKAEEALKLRTVQIELLNRRLQRAMQETHHRVKNNLQVIVSLADIALGENPDTIPAKEMRRVGQNARTLAAIHDILTQNVTQNTEMDTVTTGEIRDKLIPLIQSTLGTRPIHYEIEDVVLPVHHASSLALLISELISNSVKHGEGAITVALSCIPASSGGVPESLLLVVEDEGQGFPEGFDPRRTANTGLDLIKSLASHDLQGILEFANAPSGGAQVKARFPMPPLPAEQIVQMDGSAEPAADRFLTPVP